MSRKIKNIIMIILLITLCILMYFTITYSKNNPMNGEQMTFQDRGGNNGEMGERPTMPEGENMQREMTEIPTMPEGERNQDEITEPPTKPEGEEMQTSMTEPPKIPEGQEGQMRPANNREMMWQEQAMPDNFAKTNLIITIVVGVEGLFISLILVYLIMSKFNKTTLKETLNKASKVIIYILLVIILTAGFTVLCILLTRNTPKMKNMMMPNNFEEESTEEETKAEDISAGENVAEENIDLNKYSSNITITKAGTYNLSGEFNYSVLVNADDEVILNLNNVTIKSEITSAIANISKNGLTINLPENTSNILSDGGYSEYDGCIFSAGPLSITGDGSLEVYGNQQEGEGIATDTNNITINGGNIKVVSNDDGINAGGDGGTIAINGGAVYIKASGDGIDSNKDIAINGGSVYSMGSSLGGDAGIDADGGITINGGTLIALGSDMLEKPVATSKQNSLCFSLSSAIESGSTVTLENENDEEIIEFTADENFKTLILSNDKLETGTYYLLKNGEQVSEIKL